MCDLEVETNHSWTGRMCAGTRAKESLREDSLFDDPLAELVAGKSGMASPMGDWILVPRTRFGDDFLVYKYFQELNPCRQLVLLGAGMDTRAFRQFVPYEDQAPTSSNGRQANLMPLPELVVFEIDQPTTFDVKERLLVRAPPLTVRSRFPIPVDFNDSTTSWTRELLKNGFDPRVPTVWLLEGLVYYLPQGVVHDLFRDISQLSATGSGVFHDAVSANYVAAGRGPCPGGAPFISGNDDYAGMWQAAGCSLASKNHSGHRGLAQDGTFDEVQVRNFASIAVDRRRRCLWKASFGSSHPSHGPANAYPNYCQGRNVCLFITAEKSPSSDAAQGG